MKWRWLEKISDGFFEKIGGGIAIALGAFLGIYLGGQRASKTIVDEMNKRDSTTFVVSSVRDYAKAKEYELEGFKALINKDYDGALQSFMMSENSANRFHASYEIAYYLQKNKDSVSDPDFWEKTYKYVVENFQGYIPQEYLIKMKE